MVFLMDEELGLSVGNSFQHCLARRVISAVGSSSSTVGLVGVPAGFIFIRDNVSAQIDVRDVYET